MSADILIVDDEDDIRSLIRGILEDEGYATREAANSAQAFAKVEENVPDLVVLDIWLQGSEKDGLEILRSLKKEHKDLPFVMISGHGTIETAVSAIKDGAYDFIEKPFKSDRLLMLISRALETAALRRENAALKKRSFGEADELIGKSGAVQNIRQLIERAAPTNSRILITGEAGTGKNVVARLVHKNSARAGEGFMVLNCATLRPERLEVELFGAEGENAHTGILEQAHGGTLLLDEIADMPLETQGKIVRVLQEQRFRRVGGRVDIDSDVRVIATTNKDLDVLIERGDFREDLYYRLNVIQIHIPPLRKRTEDIAELARVFMDGMLQQFGFEERHLTNAAMNVFKSYGWPGNVRQLKNVIEWICIMHGGRDGGELGPEDLPPELSGVRAGLVVAQQGMQDSYMELSLREAREAFEREYLLAQVARFDGNISKTAAFVCMERSALHRKLKALQIHHEKNQDDAKSVSDLRKKRA
ncbi:MAG: sigma-54 dependent transcriptional regulator [Alphaproteobacteria bacterium]